jgi:hypothetical protein
MKQIIHSKQEFHKLLRNEFIPYMNKMGLNSFIKINQKEMFTTWTFCFYENKEVYLILK